MRRGTAGTETKSSRTPLHGGGRRGVGDERGSRAERHLLAGVSHPSGDPAQHRIFQVRAVFDAAAGGWVAQAAEQDPNEQRGAWEPIPGGRDAPVAFLSAAACLGDAVTRLVAMVDRDAGA